MQKLTYRNQYFVYESDEFETIQEFVGNVKCLIETCEKYGVKVKDDTTEEVAVKKPAHKFIPPTEKQKQTMDRFKIEYNANTSSEEAAELIRESIERSKN